MASSVAPSDARLPIRATVIPGPTGDEILVVPVDPGDRLATARTLRAILPGLSLRREPAGYVVRSRDAIRLHDLSRGLAAVGHVRLEWRRDAIRYVENRRRVDAAFDAVYTAVQKIRQGKVGAAHARLETQYPGGDWSQLDSHQVVNVAAMTVPDGFGLCLFDEQGTGKTVTMVHALDALVAQGTVEAAVIVAPKSMVGEWPQDIERFKPGLYRVLTATGDRAAKRQVLTAGADVVVTNFETAVSMEAEIRGFLDRYDGRAALIVDESFYAKNIDAQRTRALRRLREACHYGFVLCGTPAPNAPRDLIEQVNLVDFGHAFGGVTLPDDDDGAVAAVRDVLAHRVLYVRNLKQDVLDLPDRETRRVVVQLAPRQQELYAAARDRLLLDLRSTDPRIFAKQITSFLAQRSALLQICSNPCALVDGYDETPAKLRALDQLLEDLVVRRGEKVVLWSFYTASVDAIVRRYARYGVVRYDGTVSDTAERANGVRRFQRDNETMLFVGNPAAAGAGITLHRARVAIYESFSNQAAHYLQSLDRIHRRGQSRDVEYIVLLADGTIERSEFARLEVKRDRAHDMLGDPVPAPRTRDEFLAELVTSDT